MVLDEYLLKSAKNFEISVTNGRINEPLEYIEFNANRPDGVLYVVQKSGNYWNVFKIWPGDKGKVLTIFTNADVDLAVFYGLAACANNQ